MEDALYADSRGSRIRVILSWSVSLTAACDDSGILTAI